MLKILYYALLLLTHLKVFAFCIVCVVTEIFLWEELNKLAAAMRVLLPGATLKQAYI